MTAWPHSTWLCSGLYVEGMDSDGEDPASLERRWLKPIYSAAPQADFSGMRCYAALAGLFCPSRNVCALCALSDLT